MDVPGGSTVDVPGGATGLLGRAGLNATGRTSSGVETDV